MLSLENMASFFGEILPFSSRAVDEEDDDDADQVLSSGAVVRWSPQTEKDSKDGCLSCSTLIIAIGPAATGFTETYIIAGQKVETLGSIENEADQEVNILLQRADTDKTCFIYRLQKKPQVIIVQCKKHVPSEQSYSWVKELFCRIEKTCKVAVLATCLAASDYKSEVPPGDLNIPFLRSLKSKDFIFTPVSPTLEQPNIVTGLPAEILTYSHMCGVAAVLYMCYTDVLYLDPQTIQTFQPILKANPFMQLATESPNASKRLVELVERDSEHNTMYI